jgi:hypothetical protein
MESGFASAWAIGQGFRGVWAAYPVGVRSFLSRKAAKSQRKEESEPPICCFISSSLCLCVFAALRDNILTYSVRLPAAER